MTDTDLAIVDDSELTAFANSNGLSAEDLSGGADYLPQLKINYDEEDEVTKKALTKGTFFLTGQDVTVYAKNVTIRPLLQHFQWTEYSQSEKKTVNRTKFIVNFNEEARDEKGTVKCGKPASKVLKDNKALAEKYEDIKCYRTVHALVSYKGKDQDGNEVAVDNVLAVLRLKGSNFNPFKEEYIDNMPKGSRLWDYAINLGTTREKMGATYYYVIHFEADYTARIPVTRDVLDLAKSGQARVDEFNATVDAAYLRAVSERGSSENAIDALEAVNGDLAADLNSDDILF